MGAMKEEDLNTKIQALGLQNFHFTPRLFQKSWSFFHSNLESTYKAFYFAFNSRSYHYLKDFGN